MDDTPEVRKAIGARIRQARLAAGFKNKSKFARDVGVRENMPDRWEKGGSVPTALNLYEIARLTRTTMDWLLTGPPPHAKAALARWQETSTGASCPPEALVFLESIPVEGYEPNNVFYDLALTAWRSGLTPAEAGRGASFTSDAANT